MSNEPSIETLPTCEEALERCNDFAKKCAEANQDFKTTLETETNKLTEARAKYAQLRYSLWRYRLKDKWDTLWATILVIADPHNQPTTPGQKFKSFAKTMWAWARSGFKMSDEQTASKRLEMCRGCEHLILPQHQCSMCGCMMKNKVKIQDASCPLKKW